MKKKKDNSLNAKKGLPFNGRKWKSFKVIKIQMTHAEANHFKFIIEKWNFMLLLKYRGIQGKGLGKKLMNKWIKS